MREFKEGDIVVCLPDYTKEEKSGGSGYVSGRIFKIAKFNGSKIAWPIEADASSSKGVHHYVLRLANEFEIAWYDKKKSGVKNISNMYDDGMKKLSVHYINKKGVKTKADVNTFVPAQEIP